MSLKLHRLTIDDPESWPEPVGEGVQKVGPVPVPGGRSGTTITAGLTSFLATDSQTSSDRRRVRRQLRSLLNNLRAKHRGYWIEWSEDDEQNGWYVPGGATFDVAGQGGLYSAFWRFTGVELALLGRPRTHRPGIEVEKYDRRLSTTPIDYKGERFGGAFSTMTALSLAYLPSTIQDPVIASTSTASITGARTGYGNSQIQAAVDASHLAVIHYEQSESYRSLADVIVYDRRGVTAAPTTGPDSSWEEVYGPDFPWLDAGSDAPVLENSLCRVRYDAANTDGIIVDRWDGSAWQEAGKLLIRRLGDSTGFCDTLVRSDLMECAPDRAVVRIILRNSLDTYSREEVFVTLQRGWRGPRVEVYPAPRSAGTKAGAAIAYVVKANVGALALRPDASVSSAWSSTQTDSTFSANYGAGANLGTSTFGADDENWASLLTASGEGSVDVVTATTTPAVWVFADSSAWGSARNGIALSEPAGGIGYVSMQLNVRGRDADQVLEAESMTLSSGTSSTADGTASGGTAASATRTAEADHVTRANFASTRPGVWRILVRVRNGSAGTLNIRAQTGLTTGSAKTTTSTSYVWVDLGEVSVGTGGTTLQIRAWRSTAGTFYVDRVQAIPTTQRLGSAPLYDGARDFGQECLMQTQTPQRVVPR